MIALVRLAKRKEVELEGERERDRQREGEREKGTPMNGANQSVSKFSFHFSNLRSCNFTRTPVVGIVARTMATFARQVRRANTTRSLIDVSVVRVLRRLDCAPLEMMNRSIYHLSGLKPCDYNLNYN